MPNTKRIDLADVAIGKQVGWSWIRGNMRGSGIGPGEVVELEPRIAIIAGTGRVRHEIDRDDVAPGGVAVLEIEEPFPATDCIEHGPDCRGEVDWHAVGNGNPFKRCEHHWDARLRKRENSMERYADSDVAPDWFDPTAAGERWDEDY